LWDSLKETSAKVLSIILAKCLLKRRKQIIPTSQFGHIGCQEAQHIIKRALLICGHHNLESYAVFVVLVKAFDTVHHNLVYCILEKYGLPAIIIQNNQKLYSNCKVKTKIGKKFTKVDYATGVQQDDNMSPIFICYASLVRHPANRCPARPILVLSGK
jgi:hypothetical protein